MLRFHLWFYSLSAPSGKGTVYWGRFCPTTNFQPASHDQERESVQCRGNETGPVERASQSVTSLTFQETERERGRRERGRRERERGIQRVYNWTEGEVSSQVPGYKRIQTNTSLRGVESSSAYYRTKTTFPKLKGYTEEEPSIQRVNAAKPSLPWLTSKPIALFNWDQLLVTITIISLLTSYLIISMLYRIFFVSKNK